MNNIIEEIDLVLMDIRNNNNKDRYGLLSYILMELRSWIIDDQYDVMILVMNDIMNDKNLLSYYFPEVDWNMISVDDVYNTLFRSRCRVKNR